MHIVSDKTNLHGFKCSFTRIYTPTSLLTDEETLSGKRTYINTMKYIITQKEAVAVAM